jgi:hypothetical protein
MKRLVFCVLIAALLMAPGVANAVVCDQGCAFSFEFEDGTQILNLNGQLTTTSTQVWNATHDVQGYEILTITGQITGLYNASISSLIAPIPTVSDNILFLPMAASGLGGVGYADQYGIGFNDNNGIFYFIYDLDAGDTLLTINGGEPETFTTLKHESVSPVPEPSTWAMLLIGFTALGFMAHRHKRRAACSPL